jgi:rhomboid protease GluP
MAECSVPSEPEVKAVSAPQVEASEARLHPSEAILRLCAAAAPDPWFPRLHPRGAGVDIDGLVSHLEELWLEGLVRKAGGNAETGPGVTLTAAGQRVLDDPAALGRLRAGRPAFPGSRGAVIRQALRDRFRPFVTYLLVLLNLGVFGLGYLDARQAQADNAFLQGPGAAANPKVKSILEYWGSLSAEDIIEGRWWRLVTAGFVHIGLMHILLNMVFLYLAGRYIEQMWGHVRYLVIYLVALVGGSCLAVAHHVEMSAGASGAICGLLGAEAVWVVLNRSYLPRDLLRRARTGLVINLVLLVFISSFKDVSGWGHFGGAVAGALAAVLMHLQRFGPVGWRWLAPVGLVPLLWLGVYAIDQARAIDEKWHQVERQVFHEHYPAQAEKAVSQADAVYRGRLSPILEKHPTRRDAAAVEKALSDAAGQRDQLRQVDGRLAAAGPYRDPATEEERQTAREKIASRLRLIDEVERCLRDGEKWTPPEVREQREFEKRFAGPLTAAMKEAETLYRQRVRLLLATPPAEREAATVEEVLAAVDGQRRRLAELRDALAAAGPYRGEAVAEARQVGLAYAAAGADLLALVERCLRAGEKWTDEDRQGLRRQEKKVQKLRDAWRDLVE